MSFLLASYCMSRISSGVSSRTVPKLKRDEGWTMPSGAGFFFRRANEKRFSVRFTEPKSMILSVDENRAGCNHQTHTGGDHRCPPNHPTLCEYSQRGHHDRDLQKHFSEMQAQSLFVPRVPFRLQLPRFLLVLLGFPFVTREIVFVLSLIHPRVRQVAENIDCHLGLITAHILRLREGPLVGGPLLQDDLVSRTYVT